jgi:hypothetical protein
LMYRHKDHPYPVSRQIRPSGTTTWQKSSTAIRTPILVTENLPCHAVTGARDPLSTQTSSTRPVCPSNFMG